MNISQMFTVSAKSRIQTVFPLKRLRPFTLYTHLIEARFYTAKQNNLIMFNLLLSNIRNALSKFRPLFCQQPGHHFVTDFHPT